MKNKIFDIEFNEKTGCIRSVVLNSDPAKPNCIKPKSSFNAIVYDGKVVADNFTLSEFVQSDNHAYAVYSSSRFRLESKYSFSDDGNICVENRLINITDKLQCFSVGEVGFNLSFRDEYPDSDTCMKGCYNCHIHCGDSGASYILALKMDDSENNIGLCVTEGGFCAYSQRGVKSNDRGEFILHPSLKELKSQEVYSLCFEIFSCADKEDFSNKCKRYEAFINVTANVYSVFSGEAIRFAIGCREKPTVFCDGKKVSVELSNDRYAVDYVPKRTGEHRFTINCAGKTTITVFNVLLPLEELAARRIRFITERQQYNADCNSTLFGAYTVFDNEENKQYYSFEWADMNVGRERVGMGLLIARYLRTHKDERLMHSLMEYEAFVRREIYDEKKGTVYDDAEHGERIRLYNFLWYATFYTELCYLTDSGVYVQDVKKIIECYYLHGGYRHYPNAVMFSDFLQLMKDYGSKEDYDSIDELFQKHIASIEEVGASYPEHEVNYEQTIVSPAVTLLIDAMRTFDAEIYGAILKPHLERLDRFGGIQPHYMLNNIAIRYWDGYWFGKRHNFGDTLPHYWSCLSAVDYILYGKFTENDAYVRKGASALRNCLCLFFENGRASCARLFPFTVNGEKGEYYDPYANDQDFALYYALRFSDVVCCIDSVK